MVNNAMSNTKYDKIDKKQDDAWTQASKMNMMHSECH